MSLATRCPACTTTFKVVRDQLRISDGWVRCGRCSHVFDATLDLHEASDPPASAPPSIPEPPQQRLTEPSHAIEDVDFLDDELEQHAPPETAQSSAPEVQAAVAAPPVTESAPPPAFSLPAHGIVADEPWSDLDVSEPPWKPPASSLPPFPNIDLNLAAPPPPSPPPAPPLPVPRIEPRALVEPASADGDEEMEEEEEEEEEEEAHDQVQTQKALRRARTKAAKIATARARNERTAAEAAGSMVQVEHEPGLSVSSILEAPAGHPFSGDEDPGDMPVGFWQRKGVRRMLILLAALAVLLLAVQVIRHERDGIVARQPSLRPALAALCQYTGCELSALRQIGDIVIEGAAFAREKSGGNDYRLSFTLRNGATVPLAMPAVELSLLDTQERAVVRRVLMPADYGAPAVLPARAERAASLPLTLSVPEAAALPPIAGYRVEAFYP